MVATLLVTVKMIKYMPFGTCVQIQNFEVLKMSDTASKNLFLFFFSLDITRMFQMRAKRDFRFKTEAYVHGWNLGLGLKIGEKKDTYQYSQAEIGSHHFRD